MCGHILVSQSLEAVLFSSTIPDTNGSHFLNEYWTLYDAGQRNGILENAKRTRELHNGRTGKESVFVPAHSKSPTLCSLIRQPE